MKKTNIKDQISTAISVSFTETMQKKAPQLEARLLEGKIEKLEFVPEKQNGENGLKCVADEIEFWFPLKPIFIKKLEEKKTELVDKSKTKRKDESQKSSI